MGSSPVGSGSCGNVVFTHSAQYVTDIENDPRWDDLRSIADAFGLQSCWSMPVRTDNGGVIGTFALSSFEKRVPTAFHKNLLQIGAFIVGIVMKRREQYSRISPAWTADPYSGSRFCTCEGIMITDERNRIIEVNNAFTKMFGYTYEDVAGHDPKILSSGRHDPFYYEEM